MVRVKRSLGSISNQIIDIILIEEGCLSGRKGSTRNALSHLFGTGGSNPSPSVVAMYSIFSSSEVL